MSKKVKVLESQTIWDLAIQEYGSIDGAFLILKDNPNLDLEADLIPGTLVMINSLPLNKDVVNYIVEKKVTLASKSLTPRVTPLHPLNNGLIWYYKFNNNALKTVGTKDGEEFNVTYLPDTTGYKAVFDETSSIVIDANNDFNLGTNDFTIQVDVLFKTGGGAEQLIVGNNSDIYAFGACSFMLFRLGNQIYFVCGLNGDDYALVNTDYIITENIKYIIIAKRVGAVFTLKVNDYLYTSDNFGFVPITNYIHNMYIGVGEASSHKLIGEVSLFRGWNRALTNAEDIELFNEGNGLKF